MPDNLTADELAEGRRLQQKAANTLGIAPAIKAANDFVSWLSVHATTLLATAERVDALEAIDKEAGRLSFENCRLQDRVAELEREVERLKVGRVDVCEYCNGKGGVVLQNTFCAACDGTGRKPPPHPRP